MKYAILILLFIFVTACHKKNSSSEANEAENSASEKSKDASVVQKEVVPLFSKTLRESIYFANSLEREALKLILKDNSLQKMTLFSVLSYVVETTSGAKKSPPTGLDCGLFNVSKTAQNIVIKKACSKPFTEIVEIQTLSEDKEYQIRFSINQWTSVLGMAVILTGSDVKCRLGVVENKLNVLSCENWAYQTNEDQLSATIIRANEFLFQRNATKQFTIKGGFFKELIENKKIDIVVPLEGKIKIIEKEIKVIDEFLNQKNGVANEKKESTEFKEIKSEEVEKNKQEAHQESSDQVTQESQQINQESSQQNSQKNQETEVNNPETKPESVQSGRRGR